MDFLVWRCHHRCIEYLRVSASGKMKNALKGALLSGLVFPGLGQIVLRHYKRGFFVVLAVLACLTVIVVKAAQQGAAILEKIELDGGVIDMNAISEAAAQASAASGDFSFTLAVWGLVVLWVVGVVDAYRLGKERDKAP